MAPHYFWLLSIVAVGGEYIRHLLDKRMITMRHACTWHNLSQAEVLGALNELCEIGLITVLEYQLPSINPHNEWLVTDRNFPLTIERVNQTFGLNNREVMYYLTLEGGDKWEKVAFPRWDDYFRTIEEPESIIRIECRTQSRLKSVINWLGVCLGYEIPSIGDLSIRTVSPWQATNWKVLEGGIIATFHCCRNSITVEHDASTGQKCNDFRKWCEYGFSDVTCDRLVAL